MSRGQQAFRKRQRTGSDIWLITTSFILAKRILGTYTWPILTVTHQSIVLMLYSGFIGRKSTIITVDPVMFKQRDILQRYGTSVIHTLKKIKCKETQAQLVSLPLLFSSCQVVWRNSREIGAAWAIRKDKRLVISIKYHPGGNYVGYFKNNVFRPIATVLGPEWPHHPPGFTRCPAKFVQQTTNAVPTTTPTSEPNTTQITLPNTSQITVPTTSPSMCYALQTTSAPLSQEKIQLKVNRGCSSDKRFFFFHSGCWL